MYDKERYKDYVVNTNPLIDLGYTTEIVSNFSYNNREHEHYKGHKLTIYAVKLLPNEARYEIDISVDISDAEGVDGEVIIFEETKKTKGIESKDSWGRDYVDVELTEEEKKVTDKISERLVNILSTENRRGLSRVPNARLFTKEDMDRTYEEGRMSTEDMTEHTIMVMDELEKYFMDKGFTFLTGTDSGYDGYNYGSATFILAEHPGWLFGVRVYKYVYNKQMHDSLSQTRRKYNYLSVDVFAQHKLWIDKFKHSRSEFAGSMRIDLKPEMDAEGNILGSLNEPNRQLFDTDFDSLFKDFNLIFKDEKAAFYVHMNYSSKYDEALDNAITNPKLMKDFKKLSREYWDLFNYEEQYSKKMQLKLDTELMEAYTKLVVDITPVVRLDWVYSENTSPAYKMEVELTRDQQEEGLLFEIYETMVDAHESVKHIKDKYAKKTNYKTKRKGKRKIRDEWSPRTENVSQYPRFYVQGEIVSVRDFIL